MALGASAQEKPLVFQGAQIIPITGEPIPRGVLVVQGGKILAVGPAGQVAIPAGAEIRDVTGKVLMPGLIGQIVGPPVGGFIVTALNWHWIFWVNLPIGLAGFYLTRRFITDTEVTHQRPFDGRGFLLSGIALSTAMFAIEVGGRGGRGVRGGRGGRGGGGGRFGNKKFSGRRGRNLIFPCF